jgi:hypothetical protein
MGQVPGYAAATTVKPTAEHYEYDPTDPTFPDKYRTLTSFANVPSVIKGFADSALITIGAEVANVRAVTVQLKDADGVNLTRAGIVRFIVFTTAAATALSNGGTTGLAIGANGMIINTEIAKKVFLVKTDETGVWVGTYTDTGTDAAFLGVQLPDGRLTVSAAMTNT